jgi:myosin heavy subunit
MAHSYDVGTRAWQPDPQEGWVSSEVVEKNVMDDKVTLRFDLENGDVRLKPLSSSAAALMNISYISRNRSRPPKPPCRMGPTPHSPL